VAAGGDLPAGPKVLSAGELGREGVGLRGTSVASGGGPPWRDLFNSAAARLSDRQAARWLVEEASGSRWPRVLDQAATPRGIAAFAAMLGRREAGEPLQYVLGHWAFRSLDLLVDRRVLVPRPETEVVVGVALEELRRIGEQWLGCPDKTSGPGPAGPRAPVVVDLGTGSGAIALSVLAEHPSAVVWATDVSSAALEVASANLVGLGSRVAGRARLVPGDWWEALPLELKGCVDLVVTNPPYLSTAELAEVSPEVSCWEPRGALVPGPTGLEAIAVVLGSAGLWLSDRGSLVCEIAPSQAGAVVAMAHESGFDDAVVLADLAGRDRVLRVRRP